MPHFNNARPMGKRKLTPQKPSAYKRDLHKHAKLLDRDAENELARQALAGDVDARNKLVCANLRLVVKIAGEFRRRHIEFADVVQEGNLGLLRAVETFDPDRGIKFSTYAGFWIRSRMLNFTASWGPVLKVGHSTVTQRAVIFHGHKCVATRPDEIAIELKKDEHEVAAIMAALRPVRSLQAPIHDNDDRILEDVLGDDRPTIETLLCDAVPGELLRQALDKLTPELDRREREVLRRRLLAEDPMTLQALGDKWGVSRERARQIEERVLLKIQEVVPTAAGVRLRTSV